jgi:hypothetical protein
LIRIRAMGSRLRGNDGDGGFFMLASAPCRNFPLLFRL